VRTTAEQRRKLRQMKEWTTDTELLAQLIEEVSVLAADMRRKTPVKIERPNHLSGEESSARKAMRMLASTARVHRAA
jgi:hypothetical protein